MTPELKSNLPYLIVIVGRPGSGKTTLAHILARKIGCPVISRDEIKEGLVNSIENGVQIELNPQLHTYHVFFETIECLLNGKVSIVVEAAFQHKLWEPEIVNLQNIARIRQINCSIDAQLSQERYIERGVNDPNRVRFHGDKGVQEAINGVELPPGNYITPDLNAPALDVDTTHDYSPSIDDILSFIFS